MTDEREQGFTLIEVTITAVILLFVMTGLLGLLESQTKSDKTVQDIVATQQDVRLALTSMARDIRDGAVTGAAADEIDLSVYDSPSSTTPTSIKWKVDQLASPVKLVRQALTNGTWVTTYSLAGVTSAAPFTYVSPKGVDMAAAGWSWSLMPQCAQRVAVDLSAPTGATHSSVFDEKAEISVRNSTAQTNICP